MGRLNGAEEEGEEKSKLILFRRPEDGLVFYAVVVIDDGLE